MAPTPLPPSPAEAQREALRSFLIACFLLATAAAVGTGVPFIGSNLGFIAALIFVLVPGRYLRQKGEHESDYGLGFYDWRRGLVWALGTTLVTLVLFVPGYHLWTTKVEDRVAHLDAGNYLRPDEAFLGQPADSRNGEVHLWTWGQELILEWSPAQGPYHLEISAPDAADGAGLSLSPADFGAGNVQTRAVRRGDAPRHQQVIFHVAGVRELQIEATQGGHAVPHEFFRAGARSKAWMPADEAPVRVRLGYGWMWSVLLTQLILVAIPEEFFFRGYLQERLHQAWGRKSFRILGMPLTWAIVASSALFALSHLFVGFGLHRLAVFFPSLLFGALRERTGGITASVLYHAACNVMVLLLSVHYF